MLPSWLLLDTITHIIDYLEGSFIIDVMGAGFTFLSIESFGITNKYAKTFQISGGSDFRKIAQFETIACRFYSIGYRMRAYFNVFFVFSYKWQMGQIHDQKNFSLWCFI